MEPKVAFDGACCGKSTDAANAVRYLRYPKTLIGFQKAILDGSHALIFESSWYYMPLVGHPSRWKFSTPFKNPLLHETMAGRVAVLVRDIA